MQISLRADDGVVVRVPLRMPEAQVRGFVEERAEWIVKRLGVMAAPAPVDLATGSVVSFLGQGLRLEVAEGPCEKVERRGSLLHIETAAPRDSGVVRQLVASWYFERATKVLQATAARWAQTMCVSPRRVIVKDQARRWGSCGADGTLRFNWRLVMAEPAVIELVVVHELAHLKQRNHGRAFWAEVARQIPDLALRRKRLREVGPSLSL